MMNNFCPVCQREFEAKSVLAVYCGPVCRQKAYRGRVALILQEARGNPKAKVKPLVVPKYAIERLPGEKAIDFAIRKAEYKK